MSTQTRTDWPLPLPIPDPDTKPYWEACREHRLVVQSCSSCGALRFPPSPVCHKCRSWEFTWAEQSGTATVYSWVVAWHPIFPALASDVPYVVALVELAPGVRMPTRLVNVEPDAVYAGMPVRVAFRDVTDEITLPEFTPAGED
jgi:uncharacterized OB-fold protein